MKFVNFQKRMLFTRTHAFPTLEKEKRNKKENMKNCLSIKNIKELENLGSKDFQSYILEKK